MIMGLTRSCGSLFCPASQSLVVHITSLLCAGEKLSLAVTGPELGLYHLLVFRAQRHFPHHHGSWAWAFLEEYTCFLWRHTLLPAILHRGIWKRKGRGRKRQAQSRKKKEWKGKDFLFILKFHLYGKETEGICKVVG